jgi:hypothetical protein
MPHARARAAWPLLLLLLFAPPRLLAAPRQPGLRGPQGSSGVLRPGLRPQGASQRTPRASGVQQQGAGNDSIAASPPPSTNAFEQLYQATALLGHFSTAHQTSGARFQIPAELREITRGWVGAAAGTIASCGLDVSLLEALPQLQGQRIMIVSNLHDSEQILPHYAQQLLTAAALLLPGEVFVSVIKRPSCPLSGRPAPPAGRQLLQP